MTQIEREMLIHVLKLTKSGPVSFKIVSKEAKIPSDLVGNLAKKLENDGLIDLHEDVLEANSQQRLKLAVQAIQQGADFEHVSGFLQWKEFEDITAIAFERNGYRVKENLHFKHAGRKWEMDIIGCKRPTAICVDCKHWHHGIYPSSLQKIVQEQVERTSALAESLPSLAHKIELTSWSKIKIVPAVLSLLPGKFKFHDNVPIISVLQLQDFLNQLPAYVDSLKHFQKTLTNKFDGCS